MRRKSLEIFIILVLVTVFFVIMTGCEYKSEKENNNNTNYTINSEVKKEIYYADDETINKYISIYNNINSENKITSDMLSVYHHHGSDHKDQVTLNINDLPITITANYKDSISIYINNKNNDNTSIKSVIKKFVKTFNSSISDENIEEYIDLQGAGSSINTYDNIEYWINKDLKGDRIEYIKITGKI